MDVGPRLATLLDGAGLGLRGALATADYDARVNPAWRSTALLPGARSVLVIGSGGRALWDAACTAGLVGAHPDPLDAHTERTLAAGVALLASAGHGAAAAFAHERRAGTYADFVALGHAAGLGSPSRLGMLVHPVYGPWLSLRALLVSTWAAPVSRPRAGFDPCTGCPAPCADACHGSAVVPAGFSVLRCAAARRREATRCALRCDARHACVLGRDHAYQEDAEGHHMSRALAAVLESRDE